MRAWIAIVTAFVPVLTSAQTSGSLPALKEELAAEVTARGAGDRELGAAISAEGTARANAVTAESSARSAGDAELASAITSEATNRANGDAHLTGSLDAEAAARSAAIAAEASRASSAENGLQQALVALQAQVTELQGRVGTPASGGAAAPPRFTLIVECGSPDFSGSCQASTSGIPIGKVFVVESAMGTIIGTDSTKDPHVFLFGGSVTAVPIRCQATTAPTTTCVESTVKINLEGTVTVIAEWGGRIYARLHLFGYLQAAASE
jgi:hypothetical protein